MTSTTSTDEGEGPMSSADALSVRVFPRLYRDSVTLMALAAAAQKADGVQRVGAVMATPANLAILAEAGMLPEGFAASPDDLVIAVRATDESAAEGALDIAEAGLSAQDAGSGERVEVLPQTVAEGLTVDDGCTVAAVSTPGTYAPVVVEQALRRGLHVFCFSDNVSVADEVRLKRMAADRGLLLMGPDCGTAVLDGTPLGFANSVRPGPIAMIAASGTGAQEVSCLLDAAGAGVSQIIGVGGRDLSAEVGGLTTHVALDLVLADPGTEVVVLVSKPPAPAVADALLERLRSVGRPVVACLLGMADSDGPVLVRGTLEGGAAAAAAAVGLELTAATGAPEPPVATLAAPGVLGLYTGGTLASEAKVILGRAGIEAEVLDLGDDQFTAGRPHPMIDPSARAEHVASAGGRADVGLLLVDLVIGHGAAADPATPLADAVRAARAAAERDGRTLVVVGSVCGTSTDPQGIDGQRAILRDAGVALFASNAAAVRYAVGCVTATRAPQADREEELS
jgi:FdrA protein